MLIFHPLEMQAYSKLVKKALDAGINVIQVNLKSPNNGDAYVGANWYEIGAEAGKQLVKMCGAGSGKSGKVAIVQGVPTTATSQIAIPGFEDELKKHPEMSDRRQSGRRLGRDQGACGHQHDPETERRISAASTISGRSQAMGTAAAIKEAGKQGEVALVTYGGGQKQAGCDNVVNGNFSADVIADAKVQAADLVNVVDYLLAGEAEARRRAGRHLYADAGDRQGQRRPRALLDDGRS